MARVDGPTLMTERHHEPGRIEQVPGSPLRQVPAPNLAAYRTADGGVIMAPIPPAPPAPDRRCYRLIEDGNPNPLDTIDRDPGGSGAISAVNRAQWHSTRGGPVTVYIGARPLCRYVAGRRVDLASRV
jgi:hypothetical protein